MRLVTLGLGGDSLLLLGFGASDALVPQPSGAASVPYNKRSRKIPTSWEDYYLMDDDELAILLIVRSLYD